MRLPRYNYAPGQSVALQVEAPAILPAVLQRFEQDGFRLKDEFHVTVVQNDDKNLRPDQIQRIYQVFGALMTPPNIEYMDDLYHIAKPRHMDDGRIEPRESIVAPVKSIGIEADVALVERELQLQVTPPFLHVTLATKPDTPIARVGIGITAEEWAKDMGPKLYTENWLA